MNEFERAVRAEVYRTFRDESAAPSSSALARRLGVTEVPVVSALRALADEHCLVLRPGTASVWMAHPFSAVETEIVVAAGTRRWYANCVWDGLAILALFGDGTVDTHSPGSGEPIRFSVNRGVVSGEGIVHFLVPAARFWENIGYT